MLPVEQREVTGEMDLYPNQGTSQPEIVARRIQERRC